MDPWGFLLSKCNESTEKGRLLENNRSSTEPKIGYLPDMRVTVSGATATGAIAGSLITRRFNGRTLIARSFIAGRFKARIFIAGSLIAWSLIAWSVIAGVLREQIPENAMVSMGMGTQTRCHINLVPNKVGAT